MLKILDGSGESGKSLSEQDIKDFLTTKVLNVHLGTVDDHGDANIHPAWYALMIPRRRSTLRQENILRKWKILQVMSLAYFRGMLTCSFIICLLCLCYRLQLIDEFMLR